MLLPGCGVDSLSNHNAIDEMLEDFPNIKEVGLQVVWFIDSASLSEAHGLWPGVEPHNKKPGWSAGGYNNDSAYHISITDSGYVNYGGTVSDQDLLAFIDKLESHDLKIDIYPMIFVDNQEKSWRGFISGGSQEVVDFYHNFYQPFILHYAELLKDHVNNFYLGSELVGMTSIQDEQGNFPFVDCLIDLASKVRNILSLETNISYCANWTEYHSYKGIRHLDPLWADDQINFVGISFYMPLTDPTQEITKEAIKQGITSGEGADYYTINGQKFYYQDKSYGWKNLQIWHDNSHYEHVNGAMRETDWQPKMKPIKLGEFGIRSLDRATDMPNLYGDDMPPASNGKIDYIIQPMAIRAFLEHFKQTACLMGGTYYGYDARGKGWQYQYVDGKKLAKGHNIDDKMRRWNAKVK